MNILLQMRHMPVAMQSSLAGDGREIIQCQGQHRSYVLQLYGSWTMLFATSCGTWTLGAKSRTASCVLGQARRQHVRYGYVPELPNAAAQHWFFQRRQFIKWTFMIQGVNVRGSMRLCKQIRKYNMCGVSRVTVGAPWPCRNSRMASTVL
jgi:hypothetical protein